MYEAELIEKDGIINCLGVVGGGGGGVGGKTISQTEFLTERVAEGGYQIPVVVILYNYTV